MNNIEILEDYLKFIKQFDNNSAFIPALENLIQENKELKEKFDVIQRKIYRLEEDNIELLKPKGKDQLNYKYIECPKVEAEWYKSESYIKDNFIPKSKVKEKIEELDKRKRIKSQIKYSTIDELIFDKKIETLQELLEEGE